MKPIGSLMAFFLSSTEWLGLVGAYPAAKRVFSFLSLLILALSAPCGVLGASSASPVLTAVLPLISAESALGEAESSEGRLVQQGESQAAPRALTAPVSHAVPESYLAPGRAVLAIRARLVTGLNAGSQPASGVLRQPKTGREAPEQPASGVMRQPRVGQEAPEQPASKAQERPTERKDPAAAQEETPASEEELGHDEMLARVNALLQEVNQDSTNFDLRFELANAYYDLGSLASAVAHYRKAAELNPTDIKAWVNLGVVLNEMGLSTDALSAYDEALALDPNDNKALCNKGLAHYGLRQYYEAMTMYRRALELDPKSVEAHYNLGVAFADAQMYKEAISEWTEVAKISPDTEAAKAAIANINVILELVRLRGPEKAD